MGESLNGSYVLKADLLDARLDSLGRLGYCNLDGFSVEEVGFS
jgi:hypothetical protein